MKATRAYITTFVGLDLLRFFLSLAVILHHYYFFYYGLVDHNSILRILPYSDLFGFLYKWSYCSVQVFWLISGLIFHSVYYKEILAAKINFSEFAFLRFTRLYPLHIVTLLSVAVLQFFYFRAHHIFFNYQTEDLKHFFLQLFFMGSWYPHFQHSFNIPVWSVSVEIFVYIIFYLLAMARVIKEKGLYFFIAVTAIFNIFDILNPFGECLSFFLCGCMLARLVDEGKSLKNLLTKYGLVSVFFAMIVGAIRHYYPTVVQTRTYLLLDLLLIPISSCVILLFIIAFRKITSAWIIKLFKNLGNMTYSIYLVHFPIQLGIILILNPKDYTIFSNPLTLFSFMGLSILGGWLVFTYFEKPIQKYLRIKLGGARPGAQSTNEANIGSEVEVGGMTHSKVGYVLSDSKP